MFGSKENKEKERVEKEPREVEARIQSMVTREEPKASVIGEKVSLSGKLHVEGSIVIHGEVEGSISCTGQLTVGRTGRIKADLDVGSATIAGNVEGKVVAKGRVELQTDSHLKGDVQAKSFVIQDGCFFQGNCTMGEESNVILPQVEPKKERDAA